MKSPGRTPSRSKPTPAVLTYFEVSSCGTISYPGITEPKTRADVFQDVSPRLIHSIDELIDQVKSCQPLAWHFTELAASRLEDIEAELDDDDSGLSPMARRRLAILAAALRHDPDKGWREWVKHEGDSGLANFKEHIQDWLDDDIDWGESDYFDAGWSGQSACLAFFSDVDSAVRKALGVVIVEGEHPGSSYYAAELRSGVEQANLKAHELGLDFRFRPEGDGLPADQLLNPGSSGQGVTS